MRQEIGYECHQLRRWLRLRPVPRKKRTLPCDWLASGTWPDGQLKKTAPSEAVQMQTLSWRLRRLKEKRCWTDDAIAEAAEIARLTVHRVLNGKTWPDLVTIHRLEKVMEQRLWVNSKLPWDVGEIGPHHFHYRSRRGTYIGFVDNDRWEAEVYPTDATQGWRWEARRLTDEGWKQDGAGTATDADAAVQAVDQHIAGRVAAEQPQPDERPERQPQHTQADSPEDA